MTHRDRLQDELKAHDARQERLAPWHRDGGSAYMTVLADDLRALLAETTPPRGDTWDGGAV